MANRSATRPLQCAGGLLWLVAACARVPADDGAPPSDPPPATPQATPTPPPMTDPGSAPPGSQAPAEGAPASPDPVTGDHSQATESCITGGCSGELCLEKGAEAPLTACLHRPEYDCFKQAVCTRQADGTCGWQRTPELEACVRDARKP